MYDSIQTGLCDQFTLEHIVPVGDWQLTRQNNRIQHLIKNANFILKASIEELETDTVRGISTLSGICILTTIPTHNQ